MRIHVTKKLAEKLKKAGHVIAAEPAAPGSLLDGWHSNLVVIQRRNCVLFVHDQTRYAAALIGMTLKDLKQIDRLFEDILINSMLKLGYPAELVERASKYLTPLEFDTQCDRSVQGTLRVAALELEAQYWNGSDIMEIGPIFSFGLADGAATQHQRPQRITIPVAEQRDAKAARAVSSLGRATGNGHS
ncbi:hypothetical protein GCM10011348_04920 [Marinobacterium nitratireducens]|uniref:DUF6933 domain-containing protein n=1 Tax=Marinobacterium nitratireducens TaxID=518897 RepID=A0A917Z9Q4_9GAMM|nr:hypothetical protein [Marinobacterium nitratireducens]GGO76814.1 hypothetical protein GCM10011348_04920 [Marinobacterium nitratireducens]